MGVVNWGDSVTMSDGPKRHYWIREDFDVQMGRRQHLAPRSEDSKPTEETKKSSMSLVYPKNTEGAYRELRLRGLECDGIVLWQLAAKGIVTPIGARREMQWNGKDYLEWRKEDIDAAAEWLYEEGRWCSWTHFCWVCNLSFGQCIEARQMMSIEYGYKESFSFDPVGLITVIEPRESSEDFAAVRFFPKGTELKVTKLGKRERVEGEQ